MSSSYNWKTFTKRITINRAKEIIYRAWATQAGLENWFLRLAEFTKPDGRLRSRNEAVQRGDKYKWLWFGYDDSVVEEKDILDANNNDMLRFSFSGGCIVTVSVKEEAGETICELVQEMPMDDESEQRYFYIECGKGWTFYMTNLKSILEGGIDLRNKNVAIQNVINA
jgi:uncharacterized protein YndB with AHSA1/START domain